LSQRPINAIVKAIASRWQRWRDLALAAAICVGVAAIAIYFQGSKSEKTPIANQAVPIPSAKREPQFIRVAYGELVDRDTITHSGTTVGALLAQISSSKLPQSEGLLGELQPYLESFSFVCNDIVTSVRTGNAVPFINVLADYPAGSKQPAWAALFREGRYQFFLGNSKGRLFLKGSTLLRLLPKNMEV